MKNAGQIYCWNCKQIVDIFSKDNIIFECLHCDTKYCECGEILTTNDYGYYCSNINCQNYNKDILKYTK